MTEGEKLIDTNSFTEKDLVKMARFLEKEYFSGKLISYLTCVFPNSAYVQPGAQPGAKVKMRPEKIDEFKRQVLYREQQRGGCMAEIRRRGTGSVDESRGASMLTQLREYPKFESCGQGSAEKIKRISGSEHLAQDGKDLLNGFGPQCGSGPARFDRFSFGT